MKHIGIVEPDMKGCAAYRPPKRIKIQKPSIEFVAEQMERLLSLPMPWMMRGEQGKAALFDLVKAFHARAESSEHADAVIEELSRAEEFPTRIQIIQVCAQLAKAEWRADPMCETCSGSGFQPKQFERNGQIYTASEKCDCYGHYEKTGNA